jgi:hypothetical protein
VLVAQPLDVAAEPRRGRLDLVEEPALALGVLDVLDDPGRELAGGVADLGPPQVEARRGRGGGRRGELVNQLRSRDARRR